MASIDIKYEVVLLWLEQIFSDKDVPSFEKNERTIDILYQLSQTSIDAEKDSLALINYISKIIPETTTHVEQINSWLNSIDLNPDALSSATREELTSYSAIASALNIACPSSSNIMIGLNSLEMDLIKVKNEKDEWQERVTNLIKLSEDVSCKLQDIKEVEKRAESTSKLESEELVKMQKRSQFSKEKNRNYSSDIAYFEAKLKKSHVTEDCMHDTIMAKDRELQDLKHKVKELEDKLATYTLPPDLSLAHIKVYEKREELASIMSALAESYNE